MKKTAGRKTEVELTELARLLDEKLGCAEFSDDSSSNGLQVEGGARVRRVAVAVDACLPVIEEAVRKRADLLVVHHGLIWGGLRAIRGGLRDRISSLLASGLSLYACHLPLDAHAELGNNARILKALSAKIMGPFGSYHGRKIGWWGRLARPVSPEALGGKIERLTGAPVRLVAFGGGVQNVGVVSGGGASAISDMERSDIDTLVTGEPSHASFLQAEELKKNILFAGHYATETFGVRAVGEFLARRLHLEVFFVDHPTSF